MKQSSSSGNFVATRRFDCFVQNATIRVVGVGSTDVLSRHCHQLAGLNSDWAISHVQLDVQSQTLTLSLEFVGTRVVCPECGAEYSMKEHAVERRWCQVDAMQFQTTLAARLPRCSCDRCGVKTISVPWAEKRSRSTLLFQAFALIDQKSFGAGQDSLSVMTGIDQSRVLEATPDRTTEAADQLWKTVSDEQRSEVKAVCMDMWQAYEGTPV
jgi:transposase